VVYLNFKYENYTDSTSFNFSILSQVKAQDRRDSLNFQKARKIVFSNFKYGLDSSNYLLYNLDDKFIIIEKKEKEYILYLVKEKTGKEDSIIISRKNKILAIAFNPNYFDASIKISSQSLKPHPHFRYIYYYLMDKGKISCQYSIPTIFDQNVICHIYPINDRVHKFLIKSMFSHWKE